MHIEKAISAIKEWYDSEGFEIGGITETPKGSSVDFDQSEAFISVVGYRHSIGMDGDSFHGQVFFEYEKGKFISTSFCCWISILYDQLRDRLWQVYIYHPQQIAPCLRHAAMLRYVTTKSLALNAKRM